MSQIERIKQAIMADPQNATYTAVSYTHLRAHETREDLVCRLLLEKKKERRVDIAR